MSQKKARIFASIGLAAMLALSACGGGDDKGGSGAAKSDLGQAPGKKASMIVPFSAGGGSDLAGRAIATGLEKVTGLQITVDNIEGGSGAVGYSSLLGKEGDGTALLATETALMALPLVQDVKFTYKDFTPIMKVGDDYTLIMVKPDSKWNTCTDLINDAKKGDVMAAVSGATSLDEIVFSLIEANQGVTFKRLPYESGGEVLAGLLGGHVDVASLNPGEVIGQLESKKLKALCAVAPERYTYDILKDIPTAKEQGIDVAFAQFRGFIAAGGIDDKARDYWIKAAQEFGKSEDYKKYIDQNYLQPAALYGDDFVKYLDKYNEDLKIGLDIK